MLICDGHNYHLYIISKLNGSEKSYEEISQMDYLERCNILNSNPILLARHFQYRVELFFRLIVVNGPLGKVKYYAIRVEFQVRGSPHIHSFLWVLGAPKLTKETKDEYIRYADQVIKANLPDPEHDFDLFNLVRTYQIHSHSRSCRKYKNVECRYNFGKFFTDHTIILESLPEELKDFEREKTLLERDRILNKVKEYIDSNLNPRKANIIDQSLDDYIEPPSITEVLAQLRITEEEYYTALNISTDKYFHFKRPTNSCFVNNYFVNSLRAWEANIDIQPVINHYKAVSYMCAYFSKSEDESTEAMKQAAKEAMKSNISAYEQMKFIARAYITKRECSIQEAVYHVMPELWLRKSYPTVIFINTNLPEKRFRICRTEEELSELPEDSPDVFKRNMLDRYMDRPDETYRNGKYSAVDRMCFAEFCSHYYLSNSKCIVNDNQPHVLEDELIEQNHNICSYPATLPLMSNNNEKLKCRKVRAILRYHVPNQNKRPEEYAHHLLFMYYPFPIKIETFGNLVETALSNLRSNLTLNQDPYAQQENDEVETLIETANALLSEGADDDAVLFDDNTNAIASLTVLPTILPDDEINKMICSLNFKQRQIFDVIMKWSRDHIKHLSCIKKKQLIQFIYLLLVMADVVNHILLKPYSMHCPKQCLIMQEILKNLKFDVSLYWCSCSKCCWCFNTFWIRYSSRVLWQNYSKIE